MGHISKTPAGSFRANWRDPSGRQRAKTFATRKLASAFLAEVESATNRGSYIDPNGGKTTFGPYASAWLAARNNEKTTTERAASLMRTHIMPRWGDMPIGRISHSLMQAWVTEMSARLAPASVIKCFRLTAAVFASAIRDRLIAVSPCDGVALPSLRRTDELEFVITRSDFTGKLLPVVPARYQALVALAAGTGLRWGECVGLCLDAVDFGTKTVSVVRTAIEIDGAVSLKPYPKSRAGRRVVPLPGFAVLALKVHVEAFPPGPDGQIFTNSAGGPVRRPVFRSHVWRPSLVRAGFLGSLTKLGDGTYRAVWTDKNDNSRVETVDDEKTGVALIAGGSGPSLRFHDLRHSYATWLVSAGVPINEVAKVMGHGQTSTTLNRYTHVLPDANTRIRNTLDDFPLTPPGE